MNFSWNRQPRVKSVFFDDFANGLRTDVWRALHERWASQNNNGYSEENCLWTTSSEEVRKAGGQGGIVAIRSQGDFAADPAHKRRGGGIVTKKLFGPGLYEVRMKVVPRVGQCSAMWTYYNNWAKPMSAREYSEIDTELPHGGDYRVYSGTTYENYMSGDEKVSRSEEIFSPVPLNDGQWHTFAFEWRTDSAAGDEAIVWYQDGVPVLALREAVPHYTATFWIASLFQDAPAWLGVPRFEQAYMFIDWVRITEYDDPVSEGHAEKESLLPYVGRQLHYPLPVNEYLADGDFSRPAVCMGYKGDECVMWSLEGGARIADGVLDLPAEASAAQTVEAQYAGAAFEIEADTDGEVQAHFEYLAGKANCFSPQLRCIGRSGTAVLGGEGGQRKAVLEVAGEETAHIRLVLTSLRGAKVFHVGMRRK